MIAAYVQALRGSHRNVRLLISNSALLGFTIDGGIYGVIFNLYVLRLGFGPAYVGQVNSVANLVFAFGSMAAGWLGLRWGARRIMVVGLLFTLLGAIAVPVSDMVPVDWRGMWVLVSFVVAYSGLSLYYVNSGPYLLKATRVEARGNVFALQAAIASTASFAGTLLGGLLPALVAGLLGATLAEPGPYRVPLALVGFLVVLALIVVFYTRDVEEDQPIEAPARASGAPPRESAYRLIAFMAVVRFLQVAGVGVALTFFNVFMDSGLGVTTAQIGVIAALARLVAVPAALLGPSLSRRLGYASTTIIAATLTALSLFPIALAAGAGMAGLGFVGVMSFTSLRYPAFYVYMMEKTPERLRSVMNGGNEMAAGLSFALMSLLGGWIIVTFGYPATFITGALATLAGTGIFALYVWWADWRSLAKPAQPIPVAAPVIDAARVEGALAENTLAER